MSKKDIQILLIEHNETEIQKTKTMLCSIGNFPYDLTLATSLDEAGKYLTTSNFDVILLATELPDSVGNESFTRLIKSKTKIPIIILAYTLNESLAIDALRQGAQNYHVKNEIDGSDLVKSIIYAIERNALRIELEEKTIALQKSEERFRMIVENNKDAFLIVSKDNTIMFSNPAARSFFGASEDELLGQTFSTSDGEFLDIEHPDGKIHHGNVTSFEVEWQHNPVKIVAIHDITESKESQKKLEESQKKYSDLVEQLQEGIWLLDENLRTVFANPSLCKMFGYDLKSIIGKRPKDFVSETSQDPCDAFSFRLKEGITERIELLFIRKNGSEFCTSISTSPVHDEQGNFAGALASVQDITKEKQIRNQQRLILEILSILNRHNLWKYLIRDILIEIRKETQFSTIGIRLEQEDEKPYIEVLGERSRSRMLLECEHCDFKQPDGVRNHIDSSRCLYGLVLHRRLQDYPKNSTPFGSFWTNDLDDFFLIADPTLKEYLQHLRKNGIMDKTYALIPVLNEDKVIGIIQLSDEEPNRLNVETIKFFEEIASSVSIAFKRMQAEQELIRERNRATEYFNLAPVIMLVLGRDQLVKKINRMGCIILEGLEDEIVGKNWFDHFIPYSHREMMRNKFIEMMDSSNVYSEAIDFFPEGNMNPMVSLKGTLRELRWHNTLLFDSSGNVTGTLSSAEDLTERIEAENARRQSEEKFFKIFRYNPDAICIAQADCARIKDANEAFLEMFGYTREELFNPNFDACNIWVNPKDREAVLALLKSEGQASTQEIRFRNKAGEERISLSSFQLIKLEGENNLLSIFRDITERRKLEDHLRQAQKMEAIGTLAGGIAHDFNNILSVIVGYAELAMTSIPENSRALRDMKEVIIGSSRAKELVQQILTFSRETEQKKAPLQLGLIIKEALKMLRASIPSTIAIRRYITTKNFIFADPTQMHQIIMNLCTNSFHAMEDTGGTISVEFDDIHYDDLPDQIRPNLKESEYVKLTIKDDGPGIPVDLQERIFEPYFTTKKKGKGTGLGLAIVSGIVKNHNGGIHLVSNRNQGTKFEIFFPVFKGEAKELYGKDQAPEIQTTPARILFVDDEISIVKLHEKHLRKKGYQVISTSSSLEALQWVNEEPSKFDLVITDLTMPKLTGIELARKVLAVRPDIPIILCTGYTEKLTKEDIKRSGIKELMFKPVIISDLIHTIEKSLVRHTPSK